MSQGRQGKGRGPVFYCLLTAACTVLCVCVSPSSAAVFRVGLALQLPYEARPE